MMYVAIAVMIKQHVWSNTHFQSFQDEEFFVYIWNAL